jgi:glycosyltransferase involved in cell wall biosynthesis
MNYIFLVPGKKFGAVEMQTIKMAANAKKRGERVVVVCNNNSLVHHYANSLNLSTEFIHVTYPYIDIISAFELSLICKKYEVDVCVVSVTKFLAIATIASKFNKHKSKVYLYQQLQSGLNKKDFYHNIIYSRLSGVVVLTERMRNELIKNTIINPDSVTVIPYGIDWAKYHPASFNKNEVRQMFNLPVNKYIVGNIARIHKAQDQINVLHSFHSANIPDSVMAFCTGEELPEQNYHLQLVQEVEKLNLLDRVIFIPCTDKTVELMNSFDVYLLASRSETFSFALIEALASGLPVIAVSNGGIPEIIKHNYNGFLVTHSDIDATVKYLNEIYNNPTIAEKFKEINLSLVKHKYDLQKQSEMFFNFVK